MRSQTLMFLLMNTRFRTLCRTVRVNDLNELI